MSYGDGEQPPVSETPEPKDDTSNPVFNLPSLLVGILAALIVAYVVPAYLLSEEANNLLTSIDAVYHLLYHL